MVAEASVALTLVRRAGSDTLGKLESAARLRYREAQALQAQGEQLGAIYLYGYSIEIRLKVAYYRTIGLGPATVVSNLHRKPAEDAIKNLPALPAGTSPGHHVVGWARLLEQTRASQGSPMDSSMVTAMHRHADNVFQCWVEFLRYRANKPYNQELQAVVDAAKWFRKFSRRLWR